MVVVVCAYSSAADASTSGSSDRLSVGRGRRSSQNAVDAGASHSDERRGAGTSADAGREVAPRRPAPGARRPPGRRARVDLGRRRVDRRRENVRPPSRPRREVGSPGSTGGGGGREAHAPCRDAATGNRRPRCACAAQTRYVYPSVGTQASLKQ